MTDPEDPTRLLDSPDSPEGLKRTLERAREDVGTDAQVARLAARLGPLLGPAPLPLGTRKVTGGAATKVWLAAGLVVAGGAAWLVLAREPTAPHPVESARPTPVVAPSAPARLEPSVAVPAADPPAETLAPPQQSGAKLPPTIKPPVVAAPTEAELLEQARAALRAGDGAKALQRASEHALRYPRGVLVQEREVLAIQALRRLGRIGEADRRAESFAKAYPGSAFQRKLLRQGN